MSSKLNVDELPFLKKAVAGLVHKPHAVLPMGINDLNKLGLIYARVGPQGSTGFLPKAASAISAWASLLHRQSERYHRGANFISLREVLANSIISLLGVKEDALVANDVVSIKEKVGKWFSEQAVSRTHCVPCTIIPYEAKPFNVGPVRFVHENKFREDHKSLNMHIELWEETYFRALHERYGCWIAIVDIENAENIRSSELADLVTDIAITGLHLVLPHDISQRMARVNGRTWPAWSSQLSITDNIPQEKVNNSQPGLTMLPDYFNLLIQQQQSVLDSVGRRINSFLNLNVPINGLELSWCDAAYWFHEALSEPLDTIALAKLETTIEILLSAVSSKGSESRIRNAFSAFLGLNSSDFLASDSQVTVKDFSKSLVEARSRVLHGNWSTLTNEITVSRKDVTTLTWLFIQSFTTYLDLYLKTNSANNGNIKEFLDWVVQQRAVNTD